MEKRGAYKVSAVAATTATLVPQTSQDVAGDFADKVTNIVITFTNARDSQFFDVTNREYEVIIRRR
jgi:hypothetical protein